MIPTKQVNKVKGLNETFCDSGYVLWASSKFLESLTEWTSLPSRAHVFRSADMAIHACETWSYFSASSSIRVVKVKKGLHLFENEDSDSIVRESGEPYEQWG